MDIVFIKKININGIIFKYFELVKYLLIQNI